MNIINGIFDKEYLIDFDIGISDKVDKFKRLLQIIDNDISKEFICFKINYSDFNDGDEEDHLYIYIDHIPIHKSTYIEYD